MTEKIVLNDKLLVVIGRSESVAFPEMNDKTVMARIDTGAKTSAVWASAIREEAGILFFRLFDQNSAYYSGKEHRTENFEQRLVTSSNGAIQLRYKVRLMVKLRGKRIRGSFTLADRSSQAYPVLIGRKVLRGKFLVDVQSGEVDYAAESSRRLSIKARGEELRK